MAYTIDKTKLAELMAKARLAREQNSTNLHTTPTPDQEPVTTELPKQTKAAQTDKYGHVITYNAQQEEFVSLSSSGKSCVLVGAAGTGKTTCIKGSMAALIQSGRAGIMEVTDHKHIPAKPIPGIIIVAFTRRAVANIRKNMSEDLKDNCMTIHKLLEYEPKYYDVEDPTTGETKTTMRFEPTRGQWKPLPSSIHTIVIEEASMVSLALNNQLRAALHPNVQWIYLGDIQQLPPVFGSAILGYKMLELPTVELTQVYRQALESPIIRLAHRILSGTPIESKELESWKSSGLTLHPWKKKIHPDIGVLTVAKFFTAALAQGQYNPEEDMILIPFNKAFGTDELNKHIANYIAKEAQRNVWEVIAGFNKVYLSVGDKVLYDKEDAIIVSIKRNPAYFGKSPQKESPTLDYWGHDPAFTSSNSSSGETEDDIDIMLMAAAETAPEDRVKQCSHIITIRMMETESTLTLDKAAELNSLLLGYTLTVHKSQGSEWRKVFLVLHQSHATMLQRELLYTAVTRAKEELYIICEPESFVNGIRSQRIKGNTLAEKAEWFKGKVDETNGT